MSAQKYFHQRSAVPRNRSGSLGARNDAARIAARRSVLHHAIASRDARHDEEPDGRARERRGGVYRLVARATTRGPCGRALRRRRSSTASGERETANDEPARRASPRRDERRRRAHRAAPRPRREHVPLFRAHRVRPRLATRYPRQAHCRAHATPADGGWTSGPNAIIYTRTAQDAKLYSLARRWLLVDASGNASFLEATKAEMQRELGVPFRDLMILDPNLPTAYPSSVFIRPRAIVVNLEHIKMIVVSTYALLLGTDAPEPHARQFVAMLQRQLAPRAACQPSAVNARPPPPPTASTSAARARPPSPIPAPLSRVASSLDLEADAAAAAAMEDAIDGVHGSTTDLLGLRQTPSDLRVLALPFELRVLEAALHDVCKRLLDETMALEFDAAPALEKLADQVNSAALERVRWVKGRMNSLTQRRGRSQRRTRKTPRRRFGHARDVSDDARGRGGGGGGATPLVGNGRRAPPRRTSRREAFEGRR